MSKYVENADESKTTLEVGDNAVNNKAILDLYRNVTTHVLRKDCKFCVVIK
jgi:hypothetical protein